LQQVLMNLIVNGVEAMYDVDGPRELTIKSQPPKTMNCLLSVSDNGMDCLGSRQMRSLTPSLPPRLTHRHGTSHHRSIVESHGGRLWAADNSPRGASFCFTLPTKAEAHDDTGSRLRNVRDHEVAVVREPIQGGHRAQHRFESHAALVATGTPGGGVQPFSHSPTVG